MMCEHLYIFDGKKWRCKHCGDFVSISEASEANESLCDSLKIMNHDKYQRMLYWKEKSDKAGEENTELKARVKELEEAILSLNPLRLSTIYPVIMLVQNKKAEE